MYIGKWVSYIWMCQIFPPGIDSLVAALVPL